MLEILKHPLSFYVDKIERGEPFSSLLFGDGEFMVAAGMRTGQHFTQYRELVTQSLADEMCEALYCQDENIIKGTDPNLVNWRDYKGQDSIGFQAACQPFEELFIGRDLTFTDGVIWDTAVKTGKLAPFLRAVKQRPLVLVANHRVANVWFLNPAHKIIVPDRDAAAHLDAICNVLRDKPIDPGSVFLFCMGLGAVPLIMRLRRLWPLATFIDLGSVLDVFVKEGDQRGWRWELYRDDAKWQALVGANLEGVM